MVRVRGGGGRYMCEYGHRGVLSAKPRSGRVKQVGSGGAVSPPGGGGLGAQPLANLRILGLLDAWKLHFQHFKVEGRKLNELGCKDGGNVIFWLVLKKHIKDI